MFQHRNGLTLRLRYLTTALVMLSAIAAQAADRVRLITLPDLPGPSAFTTPSDAQGAAAREALQKQADSLQTSLASLPVGEFVISATGLDQLQSQLARGNDTSAGDVQQIINRLSTGDDYLDNPEFLRLRQSLVRYQRLLKPATASDFAAEYEARRADLERSWVNYQYGGGDAELERIRRNYAWLVDHAQAEPECRMIRRELDRGNVILKLDRQHLAALLPPAVRQIVPISTMSDGTAINGNGVLVIKPRLVLVPNSKVGDIQIVLDGSMNASLVATRGRIQAWMQSTAGLASNARMTLEGSTLAFRNQPASRASSWTYASAVRPPLNLPVFRRITGPIIQNAINRQLAASKSQMDAMIAQQMSATITAEARQMCEQINRTYDEAFFTNFRRFGLSPEVRTSTDANSLSIAYSFADDDDFAGLPPADAASASDILVHESYLAGVGRMYAGRRFDSGMFCESVFESIGLLAGDDVLVAPTESEPTVILAAQGPLRVRFRKRRWIFEVDVARVDRNGQTAEGGWTMCGQYEVAKVGANVALKRAEPATVTAHSDNQSLTDTDVQRFFPMTLQFSEFTGPGQILKSASLTIRDVTLDDGWMRVDLQSAGGSALSPNAATVAATK